MEANTITRKVKRPDGTTYDVDLRPVLVDGRGSTWYEFVNILQMSRSRELIERKAILQAMWGLTYPDVLERIERAVEAHSNDDKERLTDVLLDLYERVNYDYNDTALLELATVHYLIDDESPRGYDYETAALKKARLKEDSTAYGFFLTDTKRIVESCRTQSGRDSLDFSKVREAKNQTETEGSAYSLEGW